MPVLNQEILINPELSHAGNNRKKRYLRLPIGQQMTIENAVLSIFDLRSSIVLMFSIATYLV